MRNKPSATELVSERETMTKLTFAAMRKLTFRSRVSFRARNYEKLSFRSRVSFRARNYEKLTFRRRVSFRARNYEKRLLSLSSLYEALTCALV